MTDAELLHCALQNDDNDWELLYEFCQDRSDAERLAALLALNTTQANKAAVAWASALEELHPGLRVKLRSADPV